MSESSYDLAVIGGGTAGLVSAFVGSSLGAQVVLIERERVGGECLWTGCVPSKTLIKSARVYEAVRRAEEFGVHVEKPRLVWGAVRMRIAAVRDEIRELERAEIQKAGFDIVNGTARFADAGTLRVQTKVGERIVRARKIILATGSKARLPDVEGLREAGFLTHETVFDVANLPRSFVMLGGGAVTCELAQAFARFGRRVTILQQRDRLLPKEDAEISAACRKLLEQDGVTVHLQAAAQRAGRDDDKKWVEFTRGDGAETQTVRADEILVAVGKQPDLESLNLGGAGIRSDGNGLIVDDYLHTSAPNVWACGDATGKFLFTHVAEYQAKIAAQNALLPFKAKADYRVVPWTTFTDPEISHLGLTEDEAREAGGTVKIYRAPFNALDRAIIEGETTGFLKVVTSGSGRILGAHIIGPAAGELIHSFVPAVRDGALLQEMAETIHVYPTLSEIGHRAGNESYKELLGSKLVRWALKKII